MIDRYAQDAFASYGRLRRLDPAAARAELERFDHQVLDPEHPPGHTDRRRDTVPPASRSAEPKLRSGRNPRDRQTTRR